MNGNFISDSLHSLQYTVFIMAGSGSGSCTCSYNMATFVVGMKLENMLVSILGTCGILASIC